MSEVGSNLETLGGFKILRKLGAGGMAVVYKAQDGSLNRIVALKVIHEHLAKQPEFVARFQREARAAARLSHPNIVQIYAIGEERGLPFFSMEYVGGESLQTIIETEGFLTAKRVVPILEQAAQALAAAHEAGIVHRDIKPSNIMLDSAGRVKVTDFGIAQVATENRLTQTGMMLGTPGYVSPEQCLGHPLDARSDIYSLGVTAYELLTGRTPFAADTPAALVFQIVDQDAPPLATVNPTVPAALQSIVERMMRKDPAERFQSAHDVIDALAQCDLVSAAPATVLQQAATTPADVRVPRSSIDPNRFRRSAAATAPVTPSSLAPPPGLGTTRQATLMSHLRLPLVTAIAGAAAAGVIVALRMLGVPGAAPAPRTNEAAFLVTQPAPAVAAERDPEIGRVDADSQPAPPDTPDASPPTETDRPDGARADAAGQTPGALAADARVPELQQTDDGPRSGSPTGPIAPAAKTIVTSLTGEYEHLDLVGGWIEGVLARDDFEIIDLLPPNRSVEQVARFQVSATVKLVGARELQYFGRTQTQYTAALTLQATDLRSGTRAAGPFNTTVDYTSINLEESLKEGSERLAANLAAELDKRLGR
jgi:eukaryotic-like serine/threonine-protein kinase